MKNLFIFSLLLLFPFLLLAQKKVEYYQYIKKIDGKGVTQVAPKNSGQFIVFDNNLCYDGDINGIYIGNGKLTLSVKNSDATKYVGKAYWGEQTTYTFYHSEGILNVRDLHDNIHVYKRSTVPNGVRTSSLIHSSAYQNGSASAIYDYGDQKHNNSNQKQKDGSWNKTRSCRKCNGTASCSTCNGTGTIYSTTYGVNKYITCPSCGGSKKCSLCDGSGVEHYIAP